MQHKRPRRQAIDNFIPSGRSLGGQLQPRRQNFPDVGMTMSSYRGSLSPQLPSMTVRPIAQKRHRRWHWTKKKIIFLILLPFIIVGLWLGIKFAINASKIFDGNIFGIFSTTRLKGEENGRVNILLAGNSADDPGHDGGNLTDSIMILSLDTKDNKAFLLSIPRDLYVDIPGNGHAKINEAYVDGQKQNFSSGDYPDGGMGLLEQTIYQTLGVKTQYYALINYSALRDSVNAVGGVDFTVKSSDSRGLYDPSIDWTTRGPLVDLSNGAHKLNGEQALDLSRARGDAPGSYGYGQSDFTRTENQRQLLIALKHKVFTTGVLANPVKLGKLADSLGNNVKSDMKLGEVRRLYDLTNKVGDNAFKSYGLNELNGKDYLMSYRTARGQSTLIPAAGLDDFSDIRNAVNKLMSNSQVSKEDASVVVLNGTSTYGLAVKNQNILEGRNINVKAIGDADQPAASTYIISTTAGKTKLATLRALKSLYGSHVKTANPYAADYQADFIVVLGSDRVATLD